jgi:ornithine cyclodeaminase
VSAPLWIREADVRVLGMRTAVEALRRALEREAGGAAANLEKSYVALPGGGTLHAIGAVFPEAGLCGVKAWAHTEGGATPLELVWDVRQGHLIAVIEAFALGQLRTSAIAGVATDCLADPAADELALCGTGRQAVAQVAAVAAVRPLARVRVFGRDASRREATLARIRDELELVAEGFDAVEGAVRDAPIVTLVTRAREPFLAADAVARGAHVNALGAITPERREFEPEVLERCGAIAVDSVGQARRLASELITALGSGPGWERVQPLCDFVAAGKGRPVGADLTLFKSLGTGIADLAIAEEVVRCAKARGLGSPLPTPDPQRLRFAPGGATE